MKVFLQERESETVRLLRVICSSNCSWEKWQVFVYGVCVNIFQIWLNCELSGNGPNSTLEQKALNFMLCLGYKWRGLTRDRRQRHKLNLAPDRRLLTWGKDVSATLLWHREPIFFYIVMVRLTPWAENWHEIDFNPSTSPAKFLNYEKIRPRVTRRVRVNIGECAL